VARRALLVGLVLVACARATAAATTTPEVCGSDRCIRLPTATLTGLLTLPDALDRASGPRAQPYFVFEATDLDGRTSQVVYVPGATGALLRFPAPDGWRRVPFDDAQLLLDATWTITPYAAPTSGPARVLFNAVEPAQAVPWAALAALAGIVAIAVAVVSLRRFTPGG